MRVFTADIGFDKCIWTMPDAILTNAMLQASLLEFLIRMMDGKEIGGANVDVANCELTHDSA